MTLCAGRLSLELYHMICDDISYLKRNIIMRIILWQNIAAVPVISQKINRKHQRRAVKAVSIAVETLKMIHSVHLKRVKKVAKVVTAADVNRIINFI
ncbi:conserved hypothetical protein [Salmonella bongori NCTC 12419]|uniref:Uncharacterized protein n=1 Tax=Salmonella bongori (strain ATCC 43975 / DSM 13772 / NCTC 12419) TaxID=218493 RepID=A0A0K0HAL0_SALBC|nr:conserved hypothetical protein [Salmonella bongori NCTC 12419]